MRFLNTSLILSMFLLIPLSGQDVPVGTWKSYLSMNDVRGGVRVGSYLYGVTEGGLFRYDVENETFSLRTNADGLPTNDLTAITSDPGGRVWLGGAGGEVVFLDPEDGSSRTILEIARSTRLQKGIRSFVIEGDTVFIVSAFGVSVFRTDKWEFGDTYENFGVSVAPGVQDVAVFRDSLWIASASGLLVGWLGSTNLSAPTSWISVTNGLPSTTIRSLAVFHDTLFIGTAAGMCVNGGSGIEVLPAQNGKDVLTLRKCSDRLLMLDGQWGQSVVSELRHATDPGLRIGPAYEGPSHDVVGCDGAGSYWLMTQRTGMRMLRGGAWVTENPDVPGITSFYQVAVDGDGTVWGGSGIDEGGRGFVRFAPSASPGSRWKTFNVSTHPQLGSNDYYKVNPIDDGSVWVSSWGYGLIEVRGDSIVRKIDATTSPSVSSSDPGSQTFAVIGSVAKDQDGIVWIVNRTAVNGNVLAKLRPDGSMDYTKALLPGAKGLFSSMVIDRYGTKWFANSEPTKKAATGLYYYNEDRVVEGTAGTEGWGALTSIDGLSNNTVISLAVDKDGDVWVGTDLGVTIITDPRSPRNRRLTSFPLREQSIQSIAVDAINRKWVGTKEGVFVVSSDGSRLLEHYTVAATNGAMVDNDILSISIDRRNGIVYMGTEKGLSAYWISAVETELTYSELSFAPQPYLVPGMAPLSIRNLVENSSILVLSVDGRKIREFEAQGGGRAFWDGRDERGTYVASGVYIVVAFAENGKQIARGKVVVVNR